MIDYTFKCPRCGKAFPVNYHGDRNNTKAELAELLKITDIYIDCLHCGESLIIRTLKEGAISEKYEQAVMCFRKTEKAMNDLREVLQICKENINSFNEWDIRKRSKNNET